jgi:COP9 signalosome complex subunit 3
MDDLLPVLLSFPPHPPLPHPVSDQQYDEGIKSQIEGVKKVSTRNLLQVTSSGEHILNVSDRNHHVHLLILISVR